LFVKSKQFAGGIKIQMDSKAGGVSAKRKAQKESE
jgi:hypothetical protein